MPESTVLHATGVVPGVAHAPVVWARPLSDGGGPASRSGIGGMAGAGGDVGAGPDSVAGTGPRTGSPDPVARLNAAAENVSERLAGRSAELTGSAAEVLMATSSLALDPGWRRVATAAVRAGADLDTAVVRSFDKFIDMLWAAGGVMAERVPDLVDVRGRILAELHGRPEPGLPVVDGPAILFADDLAPADAATVDPERFVGLVTSMGGPTSHTAIIARQLGVPCLVAAGPELHSIAAGTTVLVDGAAGTITAEPDPDVADTAVAEAHAAARSIAAWQGPGRTADGVAVELLANVGDGAAARNAADGVAEGIGLFRTELSFLASASEPAVTDQVEVYGEVLHAFDDAKVVVRTLDAGSDKPLAFAALTEEGNPALGVRGLRISRSNAGLLERQLDAAALAAEQAGRGDAPTWVMAPMVATVEEATWFAGLCRERGLTPGVMIETPAAALMSESLMVVVDFVSIGTNDLAQYTMAADRLSPELAYLTDPWQPAVLRLIDMTCRSGIATGTPVGVCGEAAADPELACVLVGLGADSLSAAVAALPGVGARLSGVTMAQCRDAARAAVGATNAGVARAAARRVLDAGE